MAVDGVKTVGGAVADGAKVSQIICHSLLLPDLVTTLSSPALVR
jgi:hypothetical protein